eukprot:477131-Amphidinium_carterae.1
MMFLNSKVRALRFVTCCGMFMISFTKDFSGRGLQEMRAVSEFVILGNGFQGTLPEGGLRTMSVVINFDINSNGLIHFNINSNRDLNDGFTGTLPERGLEVMRAVSTFYIWGNGFQGTLPESGLRTMSVVTDFAINSNGFTGALPGSALQVMRA